MTTLVDQDTTFEHQDIGKHVKTHLKTFCFFIYYQRNQIGGDKNMMSLEKISFKLGEDKNQYLDKYGDNKKNVQLSFYDLDNTNDLSNSLHDLKVVSQETKTKLIFISSESALMRFYLKTKSLNLNIDTLPICLYTSGLHCDFSKFLGWGQPVFTNLSQLSVDGLEGHVRKWVQSPTEKIDIWSVEIKVSQEGGSIERLNQANGDLDKFKFNAHKELFLSNLSIGYHPHLLLDYGKRKSKTANFFDKLIYSVQGMKKFCCVGNYDMREATGVVKIDFVDDKGQHEILKYLKDPEVQQEFEEFSKKDFGNRKKVLSIALSNIDRFFGEKIKGNSSSKMNDQKLQLITFQSINQCTQILSVSGKIKMQFSPDHPVYLQVGDSCYKLEKPVSVNVQSIGKARIIINKEVLNC